MTCSMPLAALCLQVPESASELCDNLLLSVLIPWRKTKKSLPLMVSENPINGTSTFVAQEKSAIAAQIRSHSQELPPERDAQRACIQLALSGQNRTHLLGMHAISPTELAFRFVDDEYVAFVYHASETFHIDPDVGLKAQAGGELNDGMRVVLRVGIDGPWRGAEVKR
jgi:hypothetical protein